MKPIGDCGSWDPESEFQRHFDAPAKTIPSHSRQEVLRHRESSVSAPGWRRASPILGPGTPGRVPASSSDMTVSWAPGISAGGWKINVQTQTMARQSPPTSQRQLLDCPHCDRSYGAVKTLLAHIEGSHSAHRGQGCCICRDHHHGIPFFNCPNLPLIKAGLAFLPSGICVRCLRPYTDHDLDAEFACSVINIFSGNPIDMVCKYHRTMHYKICKQCFQHTSNEAAPLPRAAPAPRVSRTKKDWKTDPVTGVRYSYTETERPPSAPTPRVSGAKRSGNRSPAARRTPPTASRPTIGGLAPRATSSECLAATNLVRPQAPPTSATVYVAGATSLPMRSRSVSPAVSRGSGGTRRRGPRTPSGSPPARSPSSGAGPTGGPRRASPARHTYTKTARPSLTRSPSAEGRAPTIHPPQRKAKSARQKAPVRPSEEEWLSEVPFETLGSFLDHWKVRDQPKVKVEVKMEDTPAPGCHKEPEVQVKIEVQPPASIPTRVTARPVTLGARPRSAPKANMGFPARAPCASLAKMEMDDRESFKNKASAPPPRPPPGFAPISPTRPLAPAAARRQVHFAKWQLPPIEVQPRRAGPWQNADAPPLCHRSPGQQRALGYLCRHTRADCHTCQKICVNPAKNAVFPWCSCVKEHCALCQEDSVCSQYNQPMTHKRRADLLVRDNVRHVSRSNPDEAHRFVPLSKLDCLFGGLQGDENHCQCINCVCVREAAN